MTLQSIVPYSAPPVTTVPAVARSGTCAYLTPSLARRLVPGVGRGHRDSMPHADSCSYVSDDDESTIVLDETLGAAPVHNVRLAFRNIVKIVGRPKVFSHPSGIGPGAMQLWTPHTATVDWLENGRDFELLVGAPGLTNARLTAIARAVAPHTAG
jgi:hypothetical protein